MPSLSPDDISRKFLASHILSLPLPLSLDQVPVESLLRPRSVARGQLQLPRTAFLHYAPPSSRHDRPKKGLRLGF